MAVEVEDTRIFLMVPLDEFKISKCCRNLFFDDSSFQFQDGKIIQHHDSFNFWKWSFMALGPVGLILGWSPLVKNKIQKQAAKNLNKFIKILEA